MSAHVRERLSAFLDGELDRAERAAIAAHLAACAECSAFLEELALVDSALAQLPLPETESDDGFAARVRARIEAAGSGAPQWRGRKPSALRALPAWAWAAAAALLLAVVTPLTLRELRPPGERPGLEPAASPAAPASSRVGPAVAVSHVGPATVPAASGEPAPGVLARLEEKKRSAPSAGVPVRAPAATKPAAGGERLADRDQALGFFGSESGAPPPPRSAAARSGPARDKAEARQSVSAPTDAVVAGVAGGVAGAELAAAVPQQSVAEREISPNDARASGGERRANEQQTRAKAVAAPAPAGFVAKGAATATDEAAAAFGRLAAQRPQTAQEWRQLREAWRALVREHPDGPRADEARVRAIDAATQVYRASAEEQDKRVLRREIAEYLARKDAPEANRMRRLLRETER